jgi:hypothetical protein
MIIYCPSDDGRFGATLVIQSLGAESDGAGKLSSTSEQYGFDP